MAANTGDSYGECEQDASEFSPLPKQMEQNFTDGETQQLIMEAQHRNQDFLGSGIGFSYNEATIIANPVAETDDSKSPSAPSEPEENLPPQRFTTGLSSASATREQRLLEGTVHQQPGGTVLAEMHRLLSEDQPAPETEDNESLVGMDVDASSTGEDGRETDEESELHDLNSQQENGSGQLDASIKESPVEVVVHANPQHQSSADDLRAGALDTPDSVVVSFPTDDHNAPDTVPSPDTVATQSDHDKAVGIAEKMNPENWPQPADLQALIEEIKNPTELPDDAGNCCLPCSIPCKYKGTTYELGYKCTKQKCFALFNGTKSVFLYWTDGFTPRWKLLLMVAKIFIYLVLTVVAVVKFGIKDQQEENMVFDLISFIFSLCGGSVSPIYAIVFCIRRRREVCIILCEVWIYIVLTIYKCCCCCCVIRRLEDLKEREEGRNKDKHQKAEEYVNEMQRFKPAQNCCEKFTAFLGNTSEVLLTILDDVILTVVFILSLYNFMGNQEFTIFYGSMEAHHRLGFVFLVLSALKLIVFVHGLRFISIARNVQALDEKVERDSKVMELKLPNKFIRYCFSFQSRLVFHGLASSAFQLYGIFALSWKIIQDSCSAVAAPSIPMDNGTNGSYTSLVSPGAPFTCNLHPMVNGFTIYNILYIAIAPTLFGYISFFISNAPWLVTYMQTISMWASLQKEYTTGYRVRDDDKDSGQQGEVSKDAAGLGEAGKGDTKLCNVNEKYAYMTTPLHLVRLFCGDLLCDVSDEDLRNVGANAEGVRQAILKSYYEDVKKFGNNILSRAVTMLGEAIFFVPAAIIGVLQVILFIVHLSFMGCCVNGDVYAILSSSLAADGAALYLPLMFLFLLTSAPGPWMGLFWIFVVVGIIATVAALVASVVAIVALALLLCVLVVCLGSSSSRRNQF